MEGDVNVVVIDVVDVDEDEIVGEGVVVALVVFCDAGSGEADKRLAVKRF
jgi:hypothetical protein